MKVDNRVFIVPAMPFAMLFLVRVLWWVAGAPWTDPTSAATMSLLVGLIIGGITLSIMLGEGISMGTTTIGRVKESAGKKGGRDV
jgi:uncharacterized membrane protein